MNLRRRNTLSRFFHPMLALLAAASVLSPAAVRADVPAGSSTETVDAKAQLFSAANWYLDAIASWGISSSAVTSTGTSSPTMNQLGIGATTAWRISPNVFIGLSNDLRSAAQYSDILSSVGDVSGYRMNWLAPTVGITWRRLVVKLDAQWLGDYRIQTDEGREQLLGLPRGWRLTALYPMLRNLHLGGQIESVSFGSLAENGEAAHRSSSPIAMWQAALTAGVVF